MSEFVVVTGMSGAGRSTAAAALEDVGWFVIDNLPAGLIMKMVEMVDRPGSGIERVALVIGRGGSSTGPEYFDDLPHVLDELRATRKRVRVVFLDAPDDVLVRRYEGTRRRHPLAARGVEESIADERKLLEPVRERADLLRRHGRAQLEPAAVAHPRGVRRRRGPAHADVGDLVRLQARHPPRRRPGLRLPLPAQPVLGGGAAALQRPRRPGAGLRAGSARVGRLPREGRRPPDEHPAGVRAGGEVLPHRSRWAARAAGTAPWCWPTRWRSGCAQHGQTVSVFHRDIDR